MYSGIVVPSRVSSGRQDHTWGDNGKDQLVNPDDARPGGLMADAGTVSGVPERGGVAAVPERGGVAERREVSFRTSGLRVELEMTGGDGARRLAGRLIPAQSAVVEIRGIITVQADANGRFTAEDVPAGQLSLRCQLGTEADRARVATGWVSL